MLCALVMTSGYVAFCRKYGRETVASTEVWKMSIDWPDAEIAYLRALWADSLSQTAIARLLNDAYRNVRTRQTVSLKAAELKLPNRRFDVDGPEARDIAAMRGKGKTDVQIAAAIGKSLRVTPIPHTDHGRLGVVGTALGWPSGQ
jgi:hypothetical protein